MAQCKVVLKNTKYTFDSTYAYSVFLNLFIIYGKAYILYNNFIIIQYLCTNSWARTEEVNIINIPALLGFLEKEIEKIIKYVKSKVTQA
jgi:hypothetical protein